MCYIMMYLTLEKSTVPKLRADNPDWPPRHVDSEKHWHFYALVNGDGNLNILMTKVQDKGFRERPPTSTKIPHQYLHAREHLEAC
jgi:hypothetical protein